MREYVQNNLTKLCWIPTDAQLADGLTKTLSSDKYRRFIIDIGLIRKDQKIGGDQPESN